MNGPIYSVSFSAVAISAAQDLFALLAHADSRIAICRIELLQYSDVGDAASEILPILFQTGATTAGSGGTAPTPRNMKPWSRAAVTTARVNDTTQASNGTIVTKYASAWNIQAGFIYAPKFDFLTGYDERIHVAAGERFVVSSPAAPGDAITTNGTLWFQELGLYAG